MAFDEERFFADRGVSKEVVAARPYVRYTVDNREPVRDAYRDLSVGQRACMTRWAGLSDGFLIFRHAPPGLGLERVYPEMRPDVPIATRAPTWHCHPTVPPSEPPLHPLTGEPLASRHVHSARAMRRHIELAHGGINDEGVHQHAHVAKYTFCPNARVDERWPHDHALAYAKQPERLARHLAKWHEGNDVAGRHEHMHQVKDREHGIARRLDLHPLAVPLLASAERVFFVIEGCVKADAVLSQGEAVLSVPSVTLWKTPELKAFAQRYLQNKTVFIVADADALRKPEVMTQAKLCRSFLRRREVWAYIALPPDDRLDENIKGVDDFLGIGAGCLDDLRVLEWRLDAELAAWLLDAADEESWRQDQLERAVSALDALALHADESGILPTSIRAIADVMEVPPARVRRGMSDLVRLGAVESNVGLATVTGQWRRSRYVNEVEWAERPILTLHPRCRATRLPDRPLAAVEGPPPNLDHLGGVLRFWQEMRTPGPHGYAPRDLAILTEILEGATLSEAAEGWYRNPETARRRTPYMSWAVAMRHIATEVVAFELAAAGCPIAQIVELTGLSESTVRATLSRGRLSERWLRQVENPRLRHEAEQTVAALVAAARKAD